jgi:4,5-DOPA dioxygenase extradiol
MTNPNETGENTSPARQLMPSVFVGVGGPRQMEDPEWSEELRSWACSMPKPRGSLMFSAHWLRNPVTLGATKPVPLVYDYYNFPRHYYEVQYPAPPAPGLAERFVELLGDKLPIEASERGLDHGAFIGLMGMYPEADVPVLEVSIPTFDPEILFAIGTVLAPLREEGVMVMGAGLLNHSTQSPEANREFDAWVVETLEKRDVESLVRYQEVAPGVELALPTVEHFVPLLVAYGAAYEAGGEVVTGVEGFSRGGGSRRSLQFN